MKTLILVRHAKSSWDFPDLMDKDRPLGSRGKSDAPKMGKHLKKSGLSPDLLISSHAVRANTTAKIIAKELGYPEEDIRVVPSIYGAYSQEVLELVKMLDNKLKTVMLFGHNPEFTHLANHFSDEYIDNVPTCGVVTIQCVSENWTDFNSATAQVTSFIYPKMI